MGSQRVGHNWPRKQKKKQWKKVSKSIFWFILPFLIQQTHLKYKLCIRHYVQYFNKFFLRFHYGVLLINMITSKEKESGWTISNKTGRLIIVSTSKLPHLFPMLVMWTLISQWFTFYASQDVHTLNRLVIFLTMTVN